MLGPWKEDKDFVSSAYAKLDNTYGRLWVTTGHSAMSAQCPVCAKADTAGRFMSTRVLINAQMSGFGLSGNLRLDHSITGFEPNPTSARNFCCDAQRRSGATVW
jgi:hypothetical protein